MPRVEPWGLCPMSGLPVTGSLEWLQPWLLKSGWWLCLDITWWNFSAQDPTKIRTTLLWPWSRVHCIIFFAHSSTKSSWCVRAEKLISKAIFCSEVEHRLFMASAERMKVLSLCGALGNLLEWDFVVLKPLENWSLAGVQTSPLAFLGNAADVQC